MTIAAGLVCTDGIVIAADTEYSNYIGKWSDAKIFPFAKENYRVIVTGAGDGTLLRMCADHIELELQENYQLKDIRLAVERVLEKLVKRCIKEDPHPAEAIELIVAVRMQDGQQLLLASESARVRRVDHCHFVGIGHVLARTMASWLYTHPLTTEIAAHLVQHILYWVKENVPGCGKDSYIYLLEQRTPGQPWMAMGLNQESYFWGLNDLLKPILLGCMDTKTSEENFEHSLRAFEQKMREVRRASFQAASPPYPSSWFTPEPGPRGPIPATGAELSPSSPTEPEQQS